jgi:hypothetical protein
MAWPRLGSAAIALALGLLCGCSGGTPEGTTIRQGEGITFYEGLPHQMYEADVLAAEKKAKPTIELHGIPFYRQTLALKPGDEAKVKAVLGDAQSYETYSGEKKCGGFHPDYAVVWSVNGSTYACLICFGCGEFRIYGRSREAYYDIASAAKEPLKAILASNRQNRPPHDSWGP